MLLRLQNLKKEILFSILGERLPTGFLVCHCLERQTNESVDSRLRQVLVPRPFCFLLKITHIIGIIYWHVLVSSKGKLPLLSIEISSFIHNYTWKSYIENGGKQLKWAAVDIPPFGRGCVTAGAVETAVPGKQSAVVEATPTRFPIFVEWFPILSLGSTPSVERKTIQPRPPSRRTRLACLFLYSVWKRERQGPCLINVTALCRTADWSSRSFQRPPFPVLSFPFHFASLSSIFG